MKPIMKPLIILSFGLILLAQRSFAQIQTAASYLDVSQPAGGPIQNGDILEIRGIISVPSGTTVTALTYTSTVPASTTYQAGTLVAETNEGVIVGGIANTGAYTDAAGDDRGQITGGSNVTIYMGTGATSAAGGQVVGGTTTPVFYNAQSILMAAFRVKVTGVVGSTLTVTGTFTYSVGGVPKTATLAPITVGVYVGVTCGSVGPTNYLTDETNGTFGSGSTQNRSASPNVAGFTFVNLSANQPSDGFYSIVNNNSPTQYTGAAPAAGDRVFGLWDVIGDHTGSLTGTGNAPAANGATAGYMLAVNGTYAPSSFFTTTVGGLTTNTEYTITFWVYNLCSKCGASPSSNAASGTPGVKPNIAFSLGATDYYNTGQIAYSGQWVQGAFTFNTGPKTSVTMSIRNNAPGGGGNDFAIDDIILSTCLIILPVDLVSFKGTPEPGAILLDWETAREQNTTGFVVERSTGNNQFDSIGEVPALMRSTGGTYHFTDNSVPQATDVTYRLKIVDIDGNSSYSPLVVVAGTTLPLESLSVGPNPASYSATLYMVAAEAGSVQVSLWNMAGERVNAQTFSVSKGQNSLSLPSINRLAKGVYVVRMVSENRTASTKLLVE